MEPTTTMEMDDQLPTRIHNNYYNYLFIYE